jgi:hypothetical protein
LILVGGRIEVTRRTLATTFPQVTMTSGDGSKRTITLNQTSPGLGLGVIERIIPLNRVLEPAHKPKIMPFCSRNKIEAR